MIQVLKITYSSDPDDDEKRIESAIRNGMREASKFWKLKYLLKHFTEAGAREYGYRARTPQYMKRKRWTKKHQDPLVWSGTLGAMVLGQFPTPRIQDDGRTITAKLSLEVPQYTFYTKTKSGTSSPPKYEELVTTSEAEAKTLREIVDQRVARAMQAIGPAKTVRVA